MAMTRFRKYFSDGVKGERRSIVWPWPLLTVLAKALIPGTITQLCGGVGENKSFFLLQAAGYWNDILKVPIAIYELEEKKEVHQTRYIARLAKFASLADADWTEAHPKKAWELFNKHEAATNNFRHCLHDPPADYPSLEDIADWVEKQAEKEKRIIVVDPITAAGSLTDISWQMDAKLMKSLQHTATKHGCSIVLVTHPTKNTSARTAPDASRVAGGTSYTRHAQTILWLKKHKTPELSIVRGHLRTEEVVCRHSHTLHILKSRHGKGTNYRLAFQWSGHRLSLQECGVILRKAPKT